MFEGGRRWKSTIVCVWYNKTRGVCVSVESFLEHNDRAFKQENRWRAQEERKCIRFCQRKRNRNKENELLYVERPWLGHQKNPTGSNQAKGGIMYIFIYIYICASQPEQPRDAPSSALWFVGVDFMPRPLFSSLFELYYLSFFLFHHHHHLQGKKREKKRNIFPLFFLFICLGKFMINFTFPPSVRPSSLSVRERSKKKRKEA